MTKAIEAAVQNTLKIAKVYGLITVTPSTISIEEMKSEADALTLEAAFVKAGMRSLGVCNDAEIEMGEGFSLTIAY